MSKTFINGVLGLAINNKKQVFLTQRNEPEDLKFHAKWNIPGGGIEWGELPEDTLIREFKEELIIIPNIIFSHTIKNTSIQGDAHVLLLCYVVSIGDQVVDTSVDPDHETLASGWFSLEEVKNLDILDGVIETITQAFAIIT